MSISIELMENVSIPHRYYKSKSVAHVKSVVILFQFLIGIINPALIVLSMMETLVSIPHRYYKSDYRITKGLLSFMFQFLIGIINLFHNHIFTASFPGFNSS